MTNHATGFETLDREVSVDRLPVQGELPPWLIYKLSMSNYYNGMVSHVRLLSSWTTISTLI